MCHHMTFSARTGISVQRIFKALV
uniref:Uncharacterized protein n=1 Tax=Anguilla anguilla TaxID=7936 RepID=A0A0E9UEG0_ANGAN